MLSYDSQDRHYALFNDALGDWAWEDAFVDYVIIAGRYSRHKDEVVFKNGIRLYSKKFVLKTVIPPDKTASAPFDSAVTLDGSILIAGNELQLGGSSGYILLCTIQ